MRFYVTSLKSGKKISLDMSETSTGLDVKKMLHKEEGIPPETQTLIYAGYEFPDNCVLLERNIQRDSTFFMAIALNSTSIITVKVMMDGNAYPLEFGESDTVKVVKTKISDKLKIPPEQQRLIYAGQDLEDDRKLCVYNVHEHSTLHLIKSAPTVDDVKEKIKEIQNIPCDQQKVVYRGRHLEGNCLLSDYSIQNNAELEVILKGNITVKVKILQSSKVVKVSMDLTDTVAEIKQQLYKLENIPVNDQTLIFDGLQLSDNHLLLYCNIQNNSLLSLVLPMRSTNHIPFVTIKVNIMSTGQMVIVQLAATDTVKLIKVEISKQTGFSPQEQRLIYLGMVLKDDRTLSDYDLQNNSTVQLHKSAATDETLHLERESSTSPEPAEQPDMSEYVTPLMDAVNQLHPELIEYIDLDSLIPYLNRHNLLTRSEKYYLTNDNLTPVKKITHLLHYLESKGDVGVKKFIQAIEEEPSHLGHKSLCALFKEKCILK